MKAVVCLKLVPANNNVKLKENGLSIDKTGPKNIMNPDDKNALEEALKLKDRFDCEVIAITIGADENLRIIKEALSLGADRAIFLNEDKYDFYDELSLSKVLSKIIQKEKDVDFIFCGSKSTDSSTGFVGAMISEILSVGFVSNLKNLDIDENCNCIATRISEYGDMVFKVSSPCVFTCTKEVNDPRYPSVEKMTEVYDKNNSEYLKSVISEISLDDLGFTCDDLFDKLSVVSAELNENNKVPEILTSVSPRKAAEEFVKKLSEVNLI